MNNIRFIYSDNGTLYDYSSISNYYSAFRVIPDFIASEDYFYIGQRFPFNHFYLKLTELNILPSVMTLEYWDGQVWRAVNELFDETNGLTQSGFVTFEPDKDHAWEKESTNYQSESVEDLETLKIYDQYWIRISFDADLTVDIELKWVGNLFSNDTDLGSLYPDLDRNEIREAFRTGKTDWEEQHYLASEFIYQDLKKKNVILYRGQILNKEVFRLASVYKTASIIFNSFGRDYTDQRNDAHKMYDDSIRGLNFEIDKNMDARVSDFEKVFKTGYMKR